MSAPNVRPASGAVPTVIGTRADGSPFDPLVEAWQPHEKPAADVLERGRTARRAGDAGWEPLAGYATFCAFKPEPLHELYDPHQQAALDGAAPAPQGRLARCRQALWALVWLVVACLTLDGKPRG